MQNKYIGAIFNEHKCEFMIVFPNNNVTFTLDLRAENNEYTSEIISTLEKIREGITQLAASISANESFEIRDLADIESLQYFQKTEWTSGTVLVSLKTSSEMGRITIIIPNTLDLLEEINQVANCLQKTEKILFIPC
jgi:hypothetical protein